MNLLNTKNIQQGTKGTTSSGNVLDALGEQLQLDPEALQLLESGGHIKGMSFEHILNASEDGKSTDEIIAMMKAKGNNPEADQIADMEIPVDDKKQALLQKLQNSVAPQINNDVQAQQTINNQEANQLNQNIILNNKYEAIEEIQPVQGQTSKAIPTEAAPVQRNDLQSILGQKEAPQANTARDLQLANDIAQPEKKLVKSQVQDSNNMLELRQAANNAKAMNSQAMMPKPMNIQQANESIMAQRQAVAPAKSMSEGASLSEFMQMQSPAMRKNAAKKAYQPVGDSMFAKKVEASLPGVVKAPSQGMSLQEIMLGQSLDQNTSEQAESFSGAKSNQIAQTSANPQIGKVFDMSTMNTTKIDAVINQIQNYVVRAQAANQQEVSVSFKHSDLGQVDLFVQKAANNQINVGINTNSVEGARFFNQTQGDLLTTLQQSGLNVREMKLDGASTSSNNQQFAGSDSSKQQFGTHGKGQHQSESGERQEEANKRQELWNHYQGKEAA